MYLNCNMCKKYVFTIVSISLLKLINIAKKHCQELYSSAAPFHLQWTRIYLN